MNHPLRQIEAVGKGLGDGGRAVANSDALSKLLLPLVKVSLGSTRFTDDVGPKSDCFLFKLGVAVPIWRIHAVCMPSASETPARGSILGLK